jgi:hypothetical protein
MIALRAGMAAKPEDAFSHKAHASLKLKCVTCHSTAETNVRAGLPSIEQCRSCHVSMTERTKSEPSPTLPDFVNFSHARHAEAKTSCGTCHGDAFKEAAHVAKPLRMKFCVDCHKQQKATIACNVCHELGQ